MLYGQFENIVNYIKNTEFVVFWIDVTTKGNVYHRLTKVREHDDELKAIFEDKSGKYIDLYTTNLHDIEVYTAVDWAI